MRNGAKHSPHSGQNAKCGDPRSRVQIWCCFLMSDSFLFPPGLATRPSQPILKDRQSLIFSSGSDLWAEKAQSQVRNMALHAHQQSENHKFDTDFRISDGNLHHFASKNTNLTSKIQKKSTIG